MLAALFAQGFLYSVDTLCYWSPTIHRLIEAISPNYFFLLSGHYYLEGPLLFLATCLTIAPGRALRQRDLWHFVPFFAYYLGTWFSYYRLDTPSKIDLANHWGAIMQMPLLGWTLNLGCALALAYTIVSWRRYRMAQRAAGAGKLGEPADALARWIGHANVGILLIQAWAVVVIVHSRLTFQGHYLGEASNYLRMFVVLVLLILLLRVQPNSVVTTTEIQPTLPAAEPEPVMAEAPALTSDQPTIASVEPTHEQARLREFMLAERPFLDPMISVEKLAQKLAMSPRDLSTLLNRQMDTNFFEMISYYRIEEVKQRLADPALANVPINDIMIACGFNSKSVFNQAFKKQVGTTPSAYRKQFQI